MCVTARAVGGLAQRRRADLAHRRSAPPGPDPRPQQRGWGLRALCRAVLCGADLRRRQHQRAVLAGRAHRRAAILLALSARAARLPHRAGQIAECRRRLEAGAERRALVVLLSVIFLMIAGFGLVTAAAVLRQGVQRAGLAGHPAVLGLLLGQFLGEPFWGRCRTDRRKPVLIVTIPPWRLSYAALAFAPNTAWPSRSGSPAGLFAATSPPSSAMADITPPEKRAARACTSRAAFSPGFTTGPAIGGLLAQPSRGAGFQLPPLVAGTPCPPRSR